MLFIVAGAVYFLLACYAASKARSFRLLAAFLLAPLAPGLIVAALAQEAFYFLIVTPFSYTFAVIGFPLYFLFRWLSWLRLWQLVAAAALAGVVVAFVAGFSRLGPGGSVVNGSNAVLFAAYGGATAVVFWLVAYAKRAA